MGILNSFKNQLGRDSGKVVSNLVFGDKHATPFRRAKSREKVAEARAEAIQQQEERKKEAELNLLDAAVINAVDQVIEYDIPEDKEGIIKLLEKMEMQLEINKWKAIGGADDGEQNTIRNKYSDACLSKFKQAVKKLKRTDAELYIIEDFTKSLKKYRRRKILSKYLYLIIILSFLGACILALIIGSLFE